MPTLHARTIALVATLSAGIASLGLHGCNSAPPPYSPRQDPVSGNQYPKVVVESTLARWVVVDYPSITVDQPTNDRPLRVTVPVRSTAETTEMTIQYKYRWLDADGRPVGEADWRTTRISPRWQDRFVANSMTTKATDWRLEIRSAR